jgi:hypothetical protein
MFGLFTSWLARWFSWAKVGVAWPAGTSSAPQAPPAPAERASAGRDEAVELVSRVSSLTSAVTEQVVEHSGSISVINSELAGVQQGDATAVTNAIRKLLLANEALQQRLERPSCSSRHINDRSRMSPARRGPDGLTGC